MTPPNLSLYLFYALKLKAVPRRGGGNMFRHQMETLAILLEQGYDHPVLLKAALIHDLMEEGGAVGFYAFDEISDIDKDGPGVLALVRELSIRMINGVSEPKSEFLLRIMQQGSEQARILKLADRISNLHALPLARDPEFISRYLLETDKYIMPYANKINPAMAHELKKLMESNPKLSQL